MRSFQEGGIIGTSPASGPDLGGERGGGYVVPRSEEDEMGEKTEALFDTWALEGRADGMEFNHIRRGSQAIYAMKLKKGARVLDLGCGNGWAARYMAERTAPTGTAVGIDASSEMIAIARAVSEGNPAVSFVQGRFEALPFEDDSFDHAYSMEALYYADDLDKALSEIRRVVKPGGILSFCTDFYTDNPTCHHWPEKMQIPMTLLSQAEWTERFAAAGFTVERSFRCLDAMPPDPELSNAERAQEVTFRLSIGALALLAR